MVSDSPQMNDNLLCVPANEDLIILKHVQNILKGDRALKSALTKIHAQSRFYIRPFGFSEPFRILREIW